MIHTENAAVARFLERAGVGYDVLRHPHTESAVAEAVALGLRPGEVAKTLVLKTPSGFLRAVLPASEKLDLHRLGEAIGVERELRLATEDELVAAYPEFDVGAVPPFGGRSDPVVVDRRVAARDEVVLEAGTHEQSLRMETSDLLELTDARVADVCRRFGGV